VALPLPLIKSGSLFGTRFVGLKVPMELIKNDF
jgi:hypothetical protein